jgi:hypothetical protein
VVRGCPPPAAAQPECDGEEQIAGDERQREEIWTLIFAECCWAEVIEELERPNIEKERNQQQKIGNGPAPIGKDMDECDDRRSRNESFEG